MINELSSNHIPVLLDRRPGSRTATVSVALGSGARHDPAGAEGATHVLEHLILSVPLHGGASLSERIEEHGGSCNALTAPESLVLHAQVLADEAYDTIAWIAEALTRPRLTQELLDHELGVVQHELSAAAADPADAAQDAFLTRQFAGHPLGSPVGGDPERIAQLTVADLTRIHHRMITEAPQAIAVVGDLTPEDLLAALDKAGLAHPAPIPALGDAPSTPPPPVPPGVPQAWPDEFCWMVAGGRAPAVTDPRRHAFTVLGHLLGGSPASLLYQRLRRDESLAYHFQSWSRSYSDTGAFRMLAGAEPANAPLVLQALREVLTQVAGAAPAERAFDAAVRQSVMEVVLRSESPIDTAVWASARRILTATPAQHEDEIAALRTVTPAEVGQAAAEVLRDLVAVVRPEAG